MKNLPLVTVNKKQLHQFPDFQVVSPNLIFYAFVSILSWEQNNYPPLDFFPGGALLLQLHPYIYTVDIAVFELRATQNNINLLLPFNHFLLQDNCTQIFDDIIDFSIIEGVIDKIHRVNILQQCLENGKYPGMEICPFLQRNDIGKRKNTKGCAQHAAIKSILGGNDNQHSGSFLDFYSSKLYIHHNLNLNIY